MKFISHRGNVNQILPDRENTKEYIDEALAAGYDVEIDIRTLNGELWLGHDTPDYKVTIEWLQERKDNLWIHVKDYESLITFCDLDIEFQFFCHQGDEFTLVSNGKVWCHGVDNKMNTHCIIPLLSLKEVQNYNQTNFYAVCSDFVEQCKEKFKG
jgi:hypothetical protein